MLITLSRRTAICQSVAEVQLAGVAPLGAVSHRFNLILFYCYYYYYCYHHYHWQITDSEVAGLISGTSTIQISSGTWSIQPCEDNWVAT